MDDVMQVVIGVFPSERAAKDALRTIKRSWIARANAAIVSRSAEKGLHIKEQHDWGMGKAAVVGGLAVLAVPRIGVSLGRAGGDVWDRLIANEFPGVALQRLAGPLQAGRAVLVLLVDPVDGTQVERLMHAAGGQTLSHGLSAEMAADLAAAYIAAAGPDAVPFV